MSAVSNSSNAPVASMVTVSPTSTSVSNPTSSVTTNSVATTTASGRPVRQKRTRSKCICCSGAGDGTHHQKKKSRADDGKSTQCKSDDEEDGNEDANDPKTDSADESDSESQQDSDTSNDSDDDKKTSKRKKKTSKPKATSKQPRKAKQDKDVATWWWEYYVDTPIDTKQVGWYKYESGANVSVEREYQMWKQNGSPNQWAFSASSSSAYEIDTGKYRYGLDWNNMTQTNLTLPTHTIRKIRRLQVYS